MHTYIHTTDWCTHMYVYMYVWMYICNVDGDLMAWKEKLWKYSLRATQVGLVSSVVFSQCNGNSAKYNLGIIKGLYESRLNKV